MKNPSQEDLVGYVLGALDATEQRQVQAMIDNDPALEEQLLEIKNSLLPLEAIDSPTGPPVGLARRTCEAVAVSAKQAAAKPTNSTRLSALTTENAELSSTPNDQSSDFSLPATKINSPSGGLFAGRGSWSLSDCLITCGVILVAAAILFPALAASRHNGRLAACQNNLRSLGAAFINVSEINEGNFLSIPIKGNMAVAGSYAPQLKEMGLITDDSTFACAGQSGARTAPINIPTVEMITNAKSSEQLRHYHRTMAGDYGYSLGHSENGVYQSASRMGRAHYALLADAPSCQNAQRVSNNHGGKGQNTLFEDGHVEYVSGGTIGEDALFENNMGLVAPGADRFDSVVAPSWVTPIVLTNQPQ